MNVLFVLVQ